MGDRGGVGLSPRNKISDAVDRVARFWEPKDKIFVVIISAIINRGVSGLVKTLAKIDSPVAVLREDNAGFQRIHRLASVYAFV